MGVLFSIVIWDLLLYFGLDFNLGEGFDEGLVRGLCGVVGYGYSLCCDIYANLLNTLLIGDSVVYFLGTSCAVDVGEELDSDALLNILGLLCIYDADAEEGNKAKHNNFLHSYNSFDV